MAPSAIQRGYNSRNNFPRQNTVAVPSKIKCNRCDIVKPKAAFSNGRQADLVSHMRSVVRGFDPIEMGYISCIKCTPQQVVELNCYMCDLDKGIDRFSKAQRKTPDHAICIACAEVKANYEPDAADSSEPEGSGAEDSDDSSGDERSLAPDMSSMSVSGAGTRTMPSAASSTAGGGVAINGSTNAPSSATRSNNGASTTKSTTSNATSRIASSRTLLAANVARYGDVRGQASPSVAGTTTSSKASSNWAKPKSVYRKVQYDVAEREREEQKANENAIDDEKEFYGDSDSD